MQEENYLNIRKKSKKITKYRRYPFFNIGTLLFGTVFIYMLISMFMFLTEKHVTSYEVKNGSITGNYRYHALALRSETVTYASQSGSVRYFEREGSKVSAGSAVCAINESGSTAPAVIDDFMMSAEEERRLRETLASFTINYSGSAFQKTYDVKASVAGMISEIIEENNTGYISVRNQCYASESGFVLYETDGLEQLQESQITSDLFVQNTYSVQNLRETQKVTSGSPLFKLITDENWALYFPIDNQLMTELTDTQRIRFRFMKDNVTFSAPFSIITNGEEAFGKISLDNSLVRYVSDRYLEIELVMNKKEGLKVPVSAIVDRSFYKIPEEYAIKNEDTDQEITLKVEHFASDGSSAVKYITANVYRYEDNCYLVERGLFSEGDYIQMENSMSRYQIQADQIQTLHGVYNINKGYTVFREITILDENEEYCIVESNNIYGLAAYDYIVLNAADVTEDQIVY